MCWAPFLLVPIPSTALHLARRHALGFLPLCLSSLSLCLFRLRSSCHSDAPTFSSAAVVLPLHRHRTRQGACGSRPDASPRLATPSAANEKNQDTTTATSLSHFVPSASASARPLAAVIVATTVARSAPPQGAHRLPSGFLPLTCRRPRGLIPSRHFMRSA